jgi:hypothetical protein
MLIFLKEYLKYLLLLIPLILFIEEQEKEQECKNFVDSFTKHLKK